MQSPSAEPMTLGSPTAASPGNLGQHQYLPAYLMGEPPAVATSPTSSRMWSSKTSPSRSHNQSAWGPSPSSTMNQSHLGTSMLFASPRTEIRASSRKEKPGAPPVQGLLESMHGTTPSSGRKGAPALDVSQNASFRPTPGAYVPITPGLQTPGLSTPGGTSTPAGPYGHAKRTPPSPAQRDPFYTQGDQLKAEDELDQTWVTIFGFPPAATSYILQQFSQYGTIIKHVIASDANWMHVHFQSKFQAKKALSKNGRIFGGSIMVGVTQCIDKSVMVCEDKENADTTFRTSFLAGTPSHGALQQHGDKLNASRNTPMRPLTAAYKAASSDHEVIGQSNTPQKNNGLISKTMEYVFGW